MIAGDSFSSISLKQNIDFFLFNISAVSESYQEPSLNSNTAGVAAGKIFRKLESRSVFFFRPWRELEKHSPKFFPQCLSFQQISRLFIDV